MLRGWCLTKMNGFPFPESRAKYRSVHHIKMAHGCAVRKALSGCYRNGSERNSCEVAAFWKRPLSARPHRFGLNAAFCLAGFRAVQESRAVKTPRTGGSVKLRYPLIS